MLGNIYTVCFKRCRCVCVFTHTRALTHTRTHTAITEGPYKHRSFKRDRAYRLLTHTVLSREVPKSAKKSKAKVPGVEKLV